MDRYMELYRCQMNQVTLSREADQKILNDLLTAEKQAESFCRKQPKWTIRAVMIAAIIIIASAGATIAGIAIHGIIVRSTQTETPVENVGSTVNIGPSYYFDLLAGDAGEIYALTSEDSDSTLTDRHAIVWRSTDQCDTWESVLYLPDDLNEGSSLTAGDLRNDVSGIEAAVIIDEPDTGGGYTTRIYQLTAETCTEYRMDDIYAHIGEQDYVFQIKYVNDHTIALAATETCLLYDTDTQKVVKELPWQLDSGTLNSGLLLTPEQFVIYGEEIYTCLDAETLEDQEPEEGLQEFVRTMYAKNERGGFPPMQTQGDTILCATRSGIYEYRDGKTTQTRFLAGHEFSGLLPICRGQDGEYYICAFGDTGMILWQIDEDKEEIKK